MHDHDNFTPAKFGQHPLIDLVEKAMRFHTYTCICDPFLHLNKYINSSLKFFKHIINLLYKQFSTYYNYGDYTKQMQIKHFATYKSIAIALKYTKMI